MKVAFSEEDNLILCLSRLYRKVVIHCVNMSPKLLY